MNNLELRQLILRHRLHYYEIAQELGISEFTLSRWFRTELDEDKRQKVSGAIDRLLEGGK